MYTVDRKMNEHFSDELMGVLYDLNKIVLDSGEKMEGSLFFGHKKHFVDTNYRIPIEATPKRRYNVLNATRGKKKLLEIGMNAGHSAGFILECHKNIRVVSIDIAEHKYTPACASYLSERYGDRFHFIRGDSTQVFPTRYPSLTDVDIIHIDGGHSERTARIDMTHAIFLPNKSGRTRHIVVDDTAHPPIRELVMEMINRGYVASENYGNQWIGTSNMLVRVLPTVGRCSEAAG